MLSNIKSGRVLCPTSNLSMVWAWWNVYCCYFFWPGVAVKCNPSIGMLKTLESLGCSFDCASKGEIELVLGLGVDASRIIYANPCKQISALKYLVTLIMALCHIVTLSGWVWTSVLVFEKQKDMQESMESTSWPSTTWVSSRRLRPTSLRPSWWWELPLMILILSCVLAPSLESILMTVLTCLRWLLRWNLLLLVLGELLQLALMYVKLIII